MAISTPKTSSFFGAISKSLRFEDETSKQNDNENQAGQSSADEKLDDQLNDLKEDQDNSKGESDDADSNNDDSDPGDPGDQEDDFGDLGLGGEEDGGGDDSSDSNSGSSGIGSSPDDNQPKSIGSAPRKLTLYAEFNRIYNVLKESIAAIQRRATENSSIKNCVAQLQEIATDVRFILSNFYDRSEEDVMLQFEMVKERTSLALTLLQRQISSEKESN